MSTHEDLIARLRTLADGLMEQARLVSNMGKPESDNTFGRESVLIREAADAITAQGDEIAELKAHVSELVAERDAAETQCAEAERELDDAWNDLRAIVSERRE